MLEKASVGPTGRNTRCSRGERPSRNQTRQSLERLLKPNKCLNTAYLTKEPFVKLWDHQAEARARRFFENWLDALKWKRLKPYEKLATMINLHWHGIAAYCKPQNKVALGFVEGFNNKIRVLQRRAYGLRDEEGSRGQKLLACMLPQLYPTSKASTRSCDGRIC